MKNIIIKIILTITLISVCLLSDFQINSLIKPNFSKMKFENELANDISIDKKIEKKLYQLEYLFYPQL